MREEDRPAARPGVGSFHPSSLIPHPFLQPELLLDAAEVAAHLRQLFEAHQYALLVALRRGRGAEHALAGRDVLRDARLGADHHAVADADVIRQAGLAGDDDEIARGARAGDADLADHQVVTADLAVVADLNQVVDLRARADARRPERAAVDGR